jgi:hypothetical protein
MSEEAVDPSPPAEEGGWPVGHVDHDDIDWQEDQSNKEAARQAYFPHLKPGVPLRESDEYPTFWEGQ